MAIIYLNNLKDFQCMIKTNTCIIDFYAEWCGPCKFIAPLFEQLSTQYPNVRFCKVNIDVARDVATQLSIRSVPTFQLYSNGEKQCHLVEQIEKN